MGISGLGENVDPGGTTETSAESLARASGVLVGVAAYFDCPEHMEPREWRAWRAAEFPKLAMTPQRILAASAPWPRLPGTTDLPGIYFLHRNGRICYIGRARQLHARLRQHRSDRRPFDAVTVMAGVYHELLPSLEAAYVTAWRPPWNIAECHVTTDEARGLERTLRSMDLSLVCSLPEIPPLTPAEAEAVADRLG